MDEDRQSRQARQAARAAMDAANSPLAGALNTAVHRSGYAHTMGFQGCSVKDLIVALTTRGLPATWLANLDKLAQQLPDGSNSRFADLKTLREMLVMTLPPTRRDMVAVNTIVALVEHRFSGANIPAEAASNLLAGILEEPEEAPAVQATLPAQGTVPQELFDKLDQLAEKALFGDTVTELVQRTDPDGSLVYFFRTRGKTS